MGDRDGPSLAHPFAQDENTYIGVNGQKKHRLVRSMSRKGCSPDNAACKEFFGTMKSESYYPEKWSRLKADDLIDEIDAYIEWHNERRIESSLGYMGPMEYRKSLGYEP